jgi:hypothetical protein
MLSGRQRFSAVILAGLVAVSAAAPALADPDDHRGREWREHHRRHPPVVYVAPGYVVPGYAAPGYVVAPAPVYVPPPVIVAPPPVVYGPPVLSVTIPLR